MAKKKKVLQCAMCGGFQAVVLIERMIVSKRGTKESGIPIPWCKSCREEYHGLWKYHDRFSAHKASQRAAYQRRKGKTPPGGPSRMHRVTYEELQAENKAQAEKEAAEHAKALAKSQKRKRHDKKVRDEKVQDVRIRKRTSW